jgi:hypothetical protein
MIFTELRGWQRVKGFVVFLHTGSTTPWILIP